MPSMSAAPAASPALGSRQSPDFYESGSTEIYTSVSIAPAAKANDTGSSADT